MAFFGTALGRYVLYGLAAAAIIAGFYGLARHQGAESIRHADAKASAAASVNVAKHEAVASNISTQAASDLTATHADIQVRTVTLIKKVPVYVDAKADAACSVPTGFLSVWNAAARGETELPRPPGGSEGSASGVPLSAVLSATLENDGVAYDWRAEALTWRDWYARQKAAWNAR